MPLMLNDIQQESVARKLQGEEFIAKTFDDFIEAMMAGFMLDGYSVAPSDDMARRYISYTFWRPVPPANEFYFQVSIPMVLVRSTPGGASALTTRISFLNELRNEALSRKIRQDQRPTLWERLR